MGADGRWKSEACTTALNYVCQKIGFPREYAISTTKGPWSTASCPAGYQFAPPTNGLLNTRVAALAKGTQVWLNYPLSN